MPTPDAFLGEPAMRTTFRILGVVATAVLGTAVSAVAGAGYGSLAATAIEYGLVA